MLPSLDENQNYLLNSDSNRIKFIYGTNGCGQGVEKFLRHREEEGEIERETITESSEQRVCSTNCAIQLLNKSNAAAT